MRTTIDIDDALYRELKAKAALEGRTVRELLPRAIIHERRGAPPGREPAAVRERPAPRWFGALSAYADARGGPHTIEHEREGVAEARRRGDL